MSQTQPIFSFGVLGDLQYADVDDAYDFHRTARRYYRNSLQVLESAIQEWNQHPLTCIVQMGDLLDGFCHRGADPRVALATVRKVQERSVCQSWHNVIGNHELYNFDRAELRELLNVHYGGTTDYYSFSPHPGWRIVILDAYDISILGNDKESPEYKQALALLQANNPNNVLEYVDWIKGLEGTQRRFLPYNGSLSSAQLAWLDRTLADATAANERVIVVSHVPLHLCCCGPTVLVWNYEEVLQVLHRYPCVVAALYGHEHKGGRGIDEHGIHHIIFEAPLECPPGETAFGVMQVYSDRIELLGYGRVAPLTIPLQQQQQQQQQSPSPSPDGHQELATSL